MLASNKTVFFLEVKMVRESFAKLKNLLTLKAGWNGYDSLAPDRDAVVHAENWIVRLYLEAAELGRPWIKPNVIADAEGEVVFEWSILHTFGEALPADA